jgi:hypothetical protein
VRTRNTRMSVALLVVLVSIMFGSLACYSGQVPGLFELTPFYTPTPLNIPEEAKFEVMETVLAPQEPGRTFFYMTTDAEPLAESLVNSKSSCEGDSPAQVLYVGVDHFGDTLYLIDCGGSVGWVEEKRLVGPLSFSKDDLAIAIAPDGVATSVELLDQKNNFRPMPFSPLQTCKPETLVSVNTIVAADINDDGVKTLFYEIDCPTTGGPLKGWVVAESLFGPVEINVDARAIAVDPADGDFALTTEPAPIGEADVVEGDCAVGSVMTALEVRLVDNVAYYKVTCGDVEGWVDQSLFIGPLKYDVGINTVLYVPPVQVFADTLPGTEGDAPVVEDGGEEAVVPEGDSETVATNAHEREVLIFSPPVPLTENPGPAILSGDDANVIGQCDSGQVAHVNEYAATSSIYYNVDCKECVAEDEDGVCTEYADHTGWTDQHYLQGPIDFVIGQEVVFKESSRVVYEPEDEEGVLWARIPPSIGTADVPGNNTEYVGRCPADEPLMITGISLQKDRTRNRFTFYYAVECTGQTSNIGQEPTGTNSYRVVVTYNDNSELLSGFATARDLEPYTE